MGVLQLVQIQFTFWRFEGEIVDYFCKIQFVANFQIILPMQLAKKKELVFPDLAVDLKVLSSCV